MSVETDLITALENDPTGAGIYGDRIHAHHIPEKEIYPAVAYETQNQELYASGGTYQTKILIDLYDHSYKTVKQMRDAILLLAANNDWLPTVGSDQYEQDSKLFHIPIELEILHT